MANTVAELMSSPVVTATPDETLASATGRMRDRRVGSVVVTGGGDLAARHIFHAVALHIDHHTGREWFAAVRTRADEPARRVLARLAKPDLAAVEIDVRQTREHRPNALDIA